MQKFATRNWLAAGTLALATTVFATAALADCDEDQEDTVGKVIAAAAAAKINGVIPGASKQMINQSLKALVEQINARNAPAASAPAEPAAPPEPAAPALNGVAAPPSPSTGPSTSSGPGVGVSPVEARAAENTTAIAAEADQARPSLPAAPTAAVAQQTLPGFEQRTVIVPDHEQLKPESMVRGVIEDILKERPWLPWVAIAFLLGVLFGRARRSS